MDIAIDKKEDMRVRKTHAAIRAAFTSMLLEMPYEKITVTELSNRADINKKTFYRHYETLDDLLEEIQLEFAEPFVEITSGLRYPEDTDAITREFLFYSAKQGPLYDALASSGMHEGIFDKVLEEMGAERTRSLNPPQGWTEKEWSLFLAHVTASQVRIYRQWVEDGREVPVSRMVALGVRLICGGTQFGESVMRSQHESL